jgi:NAD(P)-dependent dehydrogenase (short-subunit alcohol dehydrogenase family)
MSLDGKLILITGAAKRVGRELVLAVAHAGADVVVHYGHSQDEALRLCAEVQALGRKAYSMQADLSDPAQVSRVVPEACEHGRLFALVNNASVFRPRSWATTSLEDWEHHLMVNLTAPFLLSQAFARQVPPDGAGRIVNLLDWRALRPAADHLPYTISKAALAALTRSLAAGLAPNISVNGLALGAALPPSSGKAPADILDHVPAGRWAEMDEVGQTLVFLLDGPAYITGEIIHVDGGRHLV